ncbi:hypothetical protein [Streptomyces sp. NPDC001635]|nr:hypothetical protein E4K10_41095 [Streptomyces sp. T1317-0309]
MVLYDLRYSARTFTAEERRSRQRVRAQVGGLLKLVHSIVGELALDAADMVDIPSTRHRRNSLWLA